MMNSRTKKIAAHTASFLTAGLAFAHVAHAAVSGIGSFRDLVDTVGKYLSTTIIPILVALGVLYFFVNLSIFIVNMNNEKEREQFKKYAVNAIIALFIMFTIWGVIGILTHTFFNTDPVVPQLPTSD